MPKTIEQVTKKEEGFCAAKHCEELALVESEYCWTHIPEGEKEAYRKKIESKVQKMESLAGAVLCKAKLSGANLSRADLSGANLCDAELFNANLSEADLSWANLSRAYLSGANLSRAILTEANLSWAKLIGAILTEANLSWANLSRADLSGAYLSGANLFEAYPGGAIFPGDFRGVAQGKRVSDSGETAPTEGSLSTEIAYFNEKKEKFLKEHEGEYVAIKGRKVICFAKSEEQAIREVCEVRGIKEAVLIRKVVKKELKHFIFAVR